MHSKASTENCVTCRNTDSYVGLLDSNKVVCTIADHSYLETAVFECFLEEGKLRLLIFDSLLVLTNDEGFVFWGCSCEDLDVVVEESS